MQKDMTIQWKTTTASLAPELKQLLEQRATARENKDFNLSDQLREQLKNNNIIVEDTAQGQTWRWA